MTSLQYALFIPNLIGIQGKASVLLDNVILTLCLQAFCSQEHMQSLITNDWC